MPVNDPPVLVFWTAAVRAKPFAEQLRAAAEGGFTSFALRSAAFTALVDGGRSPVAIRRLMEDHGVPIRHVDVVTAWTPFRVPTGLSGDAAAMFDTPIDHIREMIDMFDIATMVAVAGFDTGELSPDAATACFAGLCDDVADRGIVVNLEFMPFWGIPDLASAWAIVSGAGRPNGGIMLDSWHFMRGNPDLALLRSIPGPHLTHVQLSDAPTVMAGTIAATGSHDDGEQRRRRTFEPIDPPHERRPDDVKSWRSGRFHFCVTTNDVDGLPREIADDGGERLSSAWPGRREQDGYLMCYCREALRQRFGRAISNSVGQSLPVT